MRLLEPGFAGNASYAARTEGLYRAHERRIFEHTDRLFAGLMTVQWLAAIGAACWITPLTWAGTGSRVHLQVGAAVYLGGLITLLPVALALTRPGTATTRYVIATSQMLMSSLLIHVTGGRIETHFHVFASLVILSFYRDWRVLILATIVVAADHVVRGVYWPQSVFSVLTASHWRWLEHAGWVLSENALLVGACRRSRKDMWIIAERTAALHASEERYSAIAARAEGSFLANATTEEQLRQSHKMEAVGQLAGGIAHDFNNLLTAILGYSEMISEGLGDGHPMRRQADQISRAGRTAASLTRQLLAFSRRQVLQPAVLDMNGVVSNVDTMLRRLIGEHIDLVLGLAPDLRAITADASQLEQVILNLAVNARDAMRDGGRLTIETSNLMLAARNRYDLPPGPCVMLLVKDTGCGMDRAVQVRLFEPFFTTKPPGKGTGLGLSTVYGIVTQSGGSIAVDSAPGSGTTFRIVFPSVSQKPVAASTAARIAVAPPRVRAETVLLVEDDMDVRTLTGEALRRAGYTVLSAQHPDEALEMAACHERAIHLILTDVVMPGMNGRVLVEQLVRRHAHAKVLFMSGYTDDTLALLGVAPGGVAFLSKPFTPSVLLDRVVHVLESEPAGIELPPRADTRARVA